MRGLSMVNLRIIYKESKLKEIQCFVDVDHWFAVEILPVFRS